MRVEYKGKKIDLHTLQMKNKVWTWWYTIDLGPLRQNMDELAETGEIAAGEGLKHAKRAIDGGEYDR